MSGSALTPSHENGSPWLATLPRTARMNAKAAKVAKGAAAQRIATLALTRGGQPCDLRGLCVHRRGCDRSLTRPWRGQSVAFSEQDAEDAEVKCGPSTMLRALRAFGERVKATGFFLLSSASSMVGMSFLDHAPRLNHKPATQTSCRHRGHAYAIRKSPSNDTNPPWPWTAHDGQMAAEPASSVATRSRRPVVGQGICAGLRGCRDTRG